MPDHHETELKFVVSDPAALRESLLRLGAISQERREEENIRLDDRQRNLTARKIVLRLRRISQAGEKRTILTVKTPASAPGAFKTRREIELEIGDDQALLAALAVLGFEPYWRYEKRREVFILGDVEVDLDELPYGWFLELEGSEEGIRALADRLDLRLGEGLTLSYAEIFANVCRGMRLNIANLTFAAFAGVTVEPRYYHP